jgi:hypothetical protein
MVFPTHQPTSSTRHTCATQQKRSSSVSEIAKRARDLSSGFATPDQQPNAATLQPGAAHGGLAWRSRRATAIAEHGEHGEHGPTAGPMTRCSRRVQGGDRSGTGTGCAWRPVFTSGWALPDCVRRSMDERIVGQCGTYCSPSPWLPVRLSRPSRQRRRSRRPTARPWSARRRPRRARTSPAGCAGRPSRWRTTAGPPRSCSARRCHEVCGSGSATAASAVLPAAARGCRGRPGPPYRTLRA